MTAEWKRMVANWTSPSAIMLFANDCWQIIGMISTALSVSHRQSILNSTIVKLPEATIMFSVDLFLFVSFWC